MGSDEKRIGNRAAPQNPSGVDMGNCNHEYGEHDITCAPPANPNSPEIRLLRAIYGLCPLCNITDDHEHTDKEYEKHGMIPYKDM